MVLNGETHTYRKIQSDYVVEHKGFVPQTGKNMIHGTGTIYSMDSYQLHRILPSEKAVAHWFSPILFPVIVSGVICIKRNH